MVLPLTDDAPKVTKEILGHALELTIHHPTIGPKIWNKWITVDTIIDAIRAAAIIYASMGMNARLLGTLLPKIPKYESIDRFDGSNLSVERRSGKGKEFDFISVAEFKRHSTSRTAAATREKGSPVQRQATYIVNPQNTKSDIHERQQDSDHVSMPKNTKSDSHERQQDSDHVDMPRQQSLCGTYWDSPEAYKLFRPRPSDSNCLSAVERRIKLLQRAQQFEGWRDLVHERDPDMAWPTLPFEHYSTLQIQNNDMKQMRAEMQQQYESYG
ncbi:hypothetical protein IV203_003886 [Nitzschia inconspicua]|uniref:Uncharacterized protein n=1 Tax=Nitzschia inconspicua TaxID=303405 RepID=A0A9K3L2L6_9STRA|nr:hypothetical protein IV203_003886 [Nitzschia inconspicua]